MLKKILSTIMAATILATACTPVIAADTEAKATETAVVEPSEAFTLLTALGIDIVDVTSLDTEVKNEEFSMVLAYISGMTDELYAENTLDLMLSNSIMLQSSSSPTGKTRHEAAMKAFVSLLGYDPYAKDRGGFPSGYKAIASSIGLLDGISYSATKIMTYRELYQMADNALEIDMVEHNMSGTGTSYEIVSEATLLRDKMNIVKSRGQVTANEYTTLANGTQYRENYIEIDGNEYVSGAELNEYIGQNVDFYYHNDEDSGIDTILYMEGNENRQTIKIFTDDEFKSISGQTLTYMQNNATRKLNLKRGYAVIYNGKSLQDFTVLDSMGTDFAGTVMAIDTDSNGIYDILNVKDKESYYVGYADMTSVAIYDYYNVSNYIGYDINGEAKAFYYDAEGNEQSTETVKAGRVITFTKSEDGMLFNVYVSDSSAEGTVSSIDTGRRTVTIDGTKYSYTGSVSSKISDTMGYEIKAFLDMDGRIAGFKLKEKVVKWGLLISTAVDSSMPDEPTVYLKIFTQDGEVEKYTLSSKLQMDGISYKNKSAMARTKLENLITEEKTYIKYETVEDTTEIKKIITAESTDKIYKLFGKDLDLAWYSTPKSFNGRGLVTGSTQVVLIPASDADKVDEYRITTIDSFDNGSKYNVDGYSSGKTSIELEVVVAYMTPAQYAYTDSNGGYAIYESMIELFNTEKGETVQCVVCRSLAAADKKLQLALPDGVSMQNDITPGDIVSYSTTFSGELVSVTKVFDTETDTINADALLSTASTTSVFTSGLRYGEVFMNDSSSIVMTYKQDSTNEITTDALNMEDMRIFSKASPMTFIYHMNETDPEAVVEAVSADSVRSYLVSGDECDKVLLSSNEGKVKMIIIFRD